MVDGVALRAGEAAVDQAVLGHQATKNRAHSDPRHVDHLVRVRVEGARHGGVLAVVPGIPAPVVVRRPVAARLDAAAHRDVSPVSPRWSAGEGQSGAPRAHGPDAEKEGGAARTSCRHAGGRAS